MPLSFPPASGPGRGRWPGSEDGSPQAAPQVWLCHQPSRVALRHHSVPKFEECAPLVASRFPQVEMEPRGCALTSSKLLLGV